MSLQVWLPLTKDLRQQGLASAYKVGSNTATLTTGGKFGGCYNFTTTTGSGMLLNNDVTTFMNTYINNHSWSLCAWIKNSVDNGDTCVIALTYGLLLYGGSSTAIKLYNSTRTITCTSSVGTGDNQWHHLVATYNVDTNAIKIYVDGINTGNATYTSGYTYASSWTNGLFIGRDPNNSTANAHYFYQGQMNDVRIYDHCLSPMEVKELSKGLILHYPLNRGGFGVDNILVNTHFDSRYTQSTGWDTTKNGTQLANSWGGYNSGVTNQATVYHAHLKEFNGEWVYEYIRTANESWLGIAQSGLQSKLTAGETYTFSWEEYHVDGTNRVGTGLYYYKTNATSANFHLGIQQATEVTREIGKWQKYTYTFTAPNDADWSKNMSWYVYGHYNGNGTFYVRHIKLEEGSVATPWCPNSSDTLATAMGLNGTTEYDCSGYCNNGTRMGTFSWTSDTPKYSVSTTFSGSQYILADSPSSEGATLALWAKTVSTGNAAIVVDYKSKLGFGFWSGVIIPSCNSNIKTTYSTTNYIINQWNHIVVVRNSSSTLQLYINGVLQTNTASAQDYWSGGVIDGLSIAARPNGSSPVSCQVSDIRIYATALSADDVKSLYQNCATIDPDGTIRGQIRS